MHKCELTSRRLRRFASLCRRNFTYFFLDGCLFPVHQNQISTCLGELGKEGRRSLAKSALFLSLSPRKKEKNLIQIECLFQVRTVQLTASWSDQFSISGDPLPPARLSMQFPSTLATLLFAVDGGFSTQRAAGTAFSILLKDHSVRLLLASKPLAWFVAGKEREREMKTPPAERELG